MAKTEKKCALCVKAGKPEVADTIKKNPGCKTQWLYMRGFCPECGSPQSTPILTTIIKDGKVVMEE